MNKSLIILLVALLIGGGLFFVMRRGDAPQVSGAEKINSATSGESPVQTNQAKQVSSVSTESSASNAAFEASSSDLEILKKSVQAENSGKVAQKKINRGLQVARPRWLEGTKIAMANTRTAMGEVAKKMADIEADLRQNDATVATKPLAMKADFRKYIDALEQNDLYKQAKLQERECEMRCDKISRRMLKEKLNGKGSGGVKVVNAELSKVYDELAKASARLGEVEDEVRKTDSSVSQAYAKMIISRRIYRESLKRDTAYINAENEATELAAHYQDLIKRCEKLKKEIDNE